MGSQNSRRENRNMEANDNETEQPTSEQAEGDQDYVAVLSYLLRSGQVRLIGGGAGAGDNEDGEEEEDDDDDYGYDDYGAQSLGSAEDDGEEEEEDSEDFYWYRFGGRSRDARKQHFPKAPETFDTKALDESDFKLHMCMQLGHLSKQSACTSKLASNGGCAHMLWKKIPEEVCMPNVQEAGLLSQARNVSLGIQAQLSSPYLPNHGKEVARFKDKVFCGTYSRDGSIFLSASQDAYLRLFRTRGGRLKLVKRISAKDMGWSVLDTDFSFGWSVNFGNQSIGMMLVPVDRSGFHRKFAADLNRQPILENVLGDPGECLENVLDLNHGPDDSSIVYSSWSNYVHLCSVSRENDRHEALKLVPEDHDTGRSTAVFSVRFSSDGKELLAGTNNGFIYIYDMDRKTCVNSINGHEDDVNSVAFEGPECNMLLSGGEDGLLKVWDRRTLCEADPQPVGMLSGHRDSLTFVDSKNDGRYVLTNSKDQSVKLWDLRVMSSSSGIEATRNAVAHQRWDYRMDAFRGNALKPKLPGDVSLMTYYGHAVLRTLIRARFSPVHTTGQQYIYSGCGHGRVIVYDVLTGRVVRELVKQKSTVRDVSWHPFQNELLSSSWDGTICRWTYDGGVHI